MSSGRVLLLAGVVGAAAILGLLGWRVWGGRGGPPPLEALVDRKVVHAPRASASEVEEVRRVLVERVRSSDELQAHGLSANLLTPLREEVEAIVDAYWSEKPDAFVAYLEAEGVRPPDGYAPLSPAANESWLRYQSLIAAGELRPEEARLEVVVRRGVEQPRAKKPWMTGTRDDARPFLKDLQPSKRTDVVLIIPGSLVTVDGNPFEGAIGFRFTLLPDNTWGLVATEVHGVPRGILMGIPL